MSEEIKDKTQVAQVDQSVIDDIFGLSDATMLPDEKKPTVFSSVTPDTSFLDNPPVDGDDEDPPADPPADPPVDPANPPVDPPADPPVDPANPPAADPNDILAPPSDDNPPVPDDDPDKNKGGRPAAFITAAKKLIDKKIILPFDDGKKIEEYTAADWEELIEANFEQVQTNLQKDLPAQFFNNMPVEMQQAYQYFANGGTDVKGLFQAMGQANEIRDISVEDEAGQIYAVRSYLQATGYGTPDEIEEEIQSLQDRGDLEKKALQFKPKLDTMQQQIINQRLAAQEAQNKQRQEQSQMYMDNVYNTLAKGKLGDVELDERTQNLLYAGLVQPNYQSSTGKQTNLLGHLLEKYQWQEPNHELIAEALWLLADPDGYRNEIKKTGAAAATAETVRKLKTEQAAQGAGGGNGLAPEGGGSAQPKRPSIARPKKNFFARD